MTTLRACVLALGLLLPLPGRAVQGPAPRTVAFTGFLTDTQGHPRPDGPAAVTLALYPLPAGGAAAWTETKSVQVAHGLFSTALGDTTPIPSSVDFSRAWFVGVSVAGGAEMTPRLALQSVPYALFARALARDPAQLENASGGAMTTDGTDVTVAGDLRFGPGGAWSALATSGARQLLAGQVKGVSGEAVGAGFTSERILKGVYLISAPPDPRTALFVGTVVGTGSWTITATPEQDNKTETWHYRVETYKGGLLNDPTAFNFLIVADR